MNLKTRPSSQPCLSCQVKVIFKDQTSGCFVFFLSYCWNRNQDFISHPSTGRWRTSQFPQIIDRAELVTIARVPCTDWRTARLQSLLGFCDTLLSPTAPLLLPLYCLLRSSSRLRSCMLPSSNCLLGRFPLDGVSNQWLISTWLDWRLEPTNLQTNLRYG